MSKFFNFHTNLFVVTLLVSSFAFLLLPVKDTNSSYNEFAEWVQIQIEESTNAQAIAERDNPIFTQFNAAFGKQFQSVSKSELLNNDAFVKQLFFVWKQFFSSSDMAGTFQTDRNHTLASIYKTIYSKVLGFDIPRILTFPSNLAHSLDIGFSSLLFIPFKSLPLVNGISINAP